MRHKFSLDEVPVSQMALLGITKVDFWKMPTITLNSLLNGERTALLRLSQIRIGEHTRSLDARLSLLRDGNGQVSMFFHPVHPKLQNRYKLSSEEIGKLADPQSINISRTGRNSLRKKTTYLYFLDRITNEVVRVDQGNLRAPDVINGEQLSDNQKKQLTQGKEIQLSSGNYAIDPTIELGIREISGKQIKQIQFGESHYNANNLLENTKLVLLCAGNIVLLEHLLMYAYENWKESLKKKQKQKLNSSKNPLRTLFLDSLVKEAAVEAAFATKEAVNRKVSDRNLETDERSKILTSEFEFTNTFDKKFNEAMLNRGHSFSAIFAMEKGVPGQQMISEPHIRKEKAGQSV